jgi:hypothetical protein
MTYPPGQPPAPAAPEPQRVVSADAAMRLLLVVLSAWTFFLGLALFTQGVGLLSYGGADEGTQRILGAHLLMLAPMYALLAWRPAQYRLLAWTPYAGQLAVVLPTFWDLFITGDRHWDDGALIFVVSAVFLGLLVYMRLGAHPPSFFQPDAPEDEDDDADLDLGDPMPPDDTGADLDLGTGGRARRYRRS